jgi:PKD repeat protein
MLITHARTNDSLRRSPARRVSLLGWLPVAAAVALSGCTVKKTETPELTGPSALGRNLELTVSPDVLVMDGVSQSRLRILSRDANGRPESNVDLRVEVMAGGEIVDTIGRLSTKNTRTGGDGFAEVVYTAPNSPANTGSDSGNQGVTLIVTPAGSDYRNAFTRQVDIRLVPQGTVLPQAFAPVANFTVSPTSPGEGQDVIFDASTSIPSCVPDPANPNDASKCIPQPGTITSYQWDFGNGQTGSGVRQTVRYPNSGSYVVTLIVTNDRGMNSAPFARTIQVATVAAPNVDFAFSPGQPAVGQQVFFDANASRAAGSRTITNYSWNFGDGHFGSGVTESHRYERTGGFSVTLTVTDSAGKTGAATKAVTVGAGAVPTAAFTTSPATVRAGQVFFLDASTSQAPAGRTIVRYEWNFGDNQLVEGVRIDHVYATAGSYTVTLTVTDSGGGVDSETRTITVNP